MFCARSPMNTLSWPLGFRPEKRGQLSTMQSTGQFEAHVESPIQSPRPVSGMRVVGIEPFFASQVAGVSAAWRKLLLQAEMAAPHVQVASIEGESGVGKQTLARYLLGCSALSSSSPFRRHDAREWLLAEADPAGVTGFTYLDRVDLLAPPGQSLLLSILKTLQDRSSGPVMLVASSQASLRQLAGQGQLLPDLAFRLTAVRFAIPPLRMRREDIAPIAQALLDRICTRYQHRPVSLSSSALARLLLHPWPGNVREMACVLEGALLEAANDVIRPEDLPLQSEMDTVPAFQPAMRPSSLTLDDVIHRHVQYVLDLNHGNKLRTARQLNISRSTLYRILGNQSILTH
jgi:two-component system response regulator AtoC